MSDKPVKSNVQPTPVQSSFLDDAFSVFDEGKRLFQEVKVGTGMARTPRRLEEEQSDPAFTFALRRLVEQSTAQGGVHLVIEEGQVRTIIGAGAAMRVTEGGTVALSVLRMCEKEGVMLSSEPAKRERPPLDNKSRAAGEKDEDE